MRTILGRGGKFKCFIKETPNGQELYGRGTRFLGSYDENTDQTFKRGKEFYSYGNCLMELLDESDED